MERKRKFEESEGLRNGNKKEDYLHVVRSPWPLAATIELRRNCRGLWRDRDGEKSNLSGLMKKETDIFGGGRKGNDEEVV